MIMFSIFSVLTFSSQTFQTTLYLIAYQHSSTGVSKVCYISMLSIETQALILASSSQKNTSLLQNTAE